LNTNTENNRRSKAGFAPGETLSYIAAGVIFIAVFYYTGRVGVTPDLFVYRIAVSAATASAFLLIVLLASRAAVKRSTLDTHELYMKISKVNDRMPGGVFRCQSGGGWNITFANQNFYDFIGFSEADLMKKDSGSFLSLIHKSQRQTCAAEISRSMAKDGSVSLEIPIVCKECLKWAIFSAVLSEDKSEMFCSLSDISKIKEDNEDLREHKERYDIAMGLTHEIIYEFDTQNGTIHYSGNFTEAFGMLPDFSNFPECLAEMDTIHSDDLAKVITTYNDMRTGQNYANIDYRIKSRGIYTWYKNSMTAIKDASGRTLRVVGVLSDIDNDKRTIEQMKESAMRDPLTKLYNKTSTKALIEKYLSGGTHASLFIVDIDDFKNVNDTLGHLYGDAVLSELAHTLNVIFRSGDIAGRIGGDEFLVLMTDTDDTALAADKAQKIISRFGRSAAINAANVKISVSIGISSFPQDGANFNTLMEKADKALYSAKKSGKNNFVFFSSMDKNDLQRPATRTAWDNETPAGTENAPQKNFRENIAEYILNIFYEYDNTKKATDTVLDLIGNAYEVDRIFIYEFSASETQTNLLYEWCAHDIPSLAQRDMHLHVDPWENISGHLDENDVICMQEDDTNCSPAFKTLSLDSRGAKSVLACYSLEGGKRRAIVGFEYCREQHKFTKEEKKVISTVARMILLFTLRARDKQESIMLKRAQADREAMLDELDTIVCVNDTANYTLLYANKAARSALHIPEDYVGGKCYMLLERCDSPCTFCPNKYLTKDSYYNFEEFNPISKRHYMYKEKLIEWNGKNAKLAYGTDITDKETTLRNLEDRLHTDDAMLDGLNALVTAPTLSEAMDSVLRCIRDYYDADACFIFESDRKQEFLTMTYECSAEGLRQKKEQLTKVSMKDEPFWRSVFRNGQDVFVDDIVAFRDNVAEYESLRRNDISSLYAAMLDTDTDSIGYLGISNPKLSKNAVLLKSFALIVVDEIRKRRELEK